MPDTSDTNTLEQARTMLRTTADNSRLVALANKVRNPIRHTTKQLADYTRESYLYRWLTKEPDPEIIVIDLRETYTVGPIIAILDHLVDRVADFEDRIAPYWYGSTLNQGFDWSSHQLHRLADTQAGRTLIALLEPPEPPDEEDQD